MSETAAQTPPDPKVAFQTLGLTKIYKTDGAEVHVLRGVNIELYDGEIVVMHPSDRIEDGIRIAAR